MRLIFFASSDPGSEPKPIWSAYHFVEVAARSGLDAEVRLAGDAVRVAQEGMVAETELGFEVRAKVIHGGGTRPTWCPSDRAVSTPVRCPSSR